MQSSVFSELAQGPRAFRETRRGGHIPRQPARRNSMEIKAEEFHSPRLSFVFGDNRQVIEHDGNPRKPLRRSSRVDSEDLSAQLRALALEMNYDDDDDEGKNSNYSSSQPDEMEEIMNMSFNSGFLSRAHSSVLSYPSHYFI